MQPTVALAFSGGLDTSYCVPRLAEQGYGVQTVFVNTGGASREQCAAILAQAMAVGSAGHHEIDARAAVFDRFVRVLIQANVLRGEVYPLSVAAERTQQAMSVVEVARRIGATAVAHGSTGPATTRSDRHCLPSAGARVDHYHPNSRRGVTRERAIAFLTERELPVPAKSGEFSVIAGSGGPHGAVVGPMTPGQGHR